MKTHQPKRNFIVLITMLLACGAMTAQTINYGVRIAGEDLTSNNVMAINNTNFSKLGLRHGTITYNHTTRTITLNNVVADVSSTFLFIPHSVEYTEYKLNLVGTNEINISGDFDAIRFHKTLNIIGDLLKINTINQAALYVGDNSTLFIKDATVEVMGKWGIAGDDGISGEKLIIENSTVKATGTTNGSIVELQDITLTNCAITAPVGAVIANSSPGGKAVMLGGQVVKTQVVIKPTSTGVATPLTETFSIYPNPVVDVLHVETEGEVHTIRMYNMYGVEVAHVTSNTINVSNLPTGVYIVAVETDKGTRRERMIKK